MPSNVGVAIPVGNWPQINNVADSLNLNSLGLPPALALEEQALNRRQQLANVLMQKSLQPAQGQMAGRFYVPPTWAQGLSQLGSAAAGVGLNVANDYKRQDIADESQNIMSQAMQKYRQSLEPAAVEGDAYGPGQPVQNTVSYNMQNMSDPSLTPSGTWDIDKLQPDTSQQVQENKNRLAMAMMPQAQAPQAEAPLAGVPQNMNPWTMELIGKANQPPAAPVPTAQPDPLAAAFDQGQHYTRQPFSQPYSEITMNAPTAEGQRPTGTQYVERTPEERRNALVELMANQHPQARAIGQMLMQQETAQQEKATEREQKERFHTDDVRLREMGIVENASGKLATLQNTMAMKEMDIAQREAARQDTRSLRESLESDKREYQRMQQQLERGRLDESSRHNREIEAISKQNAETKRDRQDLSPTAQKELFETDDALLAGKGVMTALSQARALNDKAYDGFQADTRAALGTNIPGIPKEGADATVELDNIIKNQALGQLKAAFGSMPTEGERKILLEVQGSVNLSKSQRLGIWQRAEEALKRKMEFNERKSRALREGTYFKEGFMDAAPTAPTAPANGGWSITPIP